MQPKEDSARLAKTDPFKGKVLDKYLLIERLGAGGMGMVYRAEQKQLKRQVAVKLLSLRLINDEVNVKRIEREATGMGRLQHPNIATIIDFGISEEGQPFLVMELINGKSLKQLLKECKLLQPERAMKIMSQVADAMQYAHKNGFIHRDLKPDNIMLASEHKDDFVKVLDFGIAKSTTEATINLTKAGDVVGSPLYMSPEQCTGKKLDLRSDIYSLGVIMYEALTGIVPCQGATLFETISKKTMEPPPPFPAHLAHLRALENLTLACLATYPEDRPPSMQVIKDSLDALSSYPAGLMGGMQTGSGYHPAGHIGTYPGTGPAASGSYPPGMAGGAYQGMGTTGGAYPPGMGTTGGAYPPGMGTTGGAYPPGMGTTGGAYPPGMGTTGSAYPPGMGTTGGAYPPAMGTTGGAYPAGMQTTGGAHANQNYNNMPSHGYASHIEKEQGFSLSKHIVLLLIVVGLAFVVGGTVLGVGLWNAISSRDTNDLDDSKKADGSDRASKGTAGGDKTTSGDKNASSEKSGSLTDNSRENSTTTNTESNTNNKSTTADNQTLSDNRKTDQVAGKQTKRGERIIIIRETRKSEKPARVRIGHHSAVYTNDLPRHGGRFLPGASGNSGYTQRNSPANPNPYTPVETQPAQTSQTNNQRSSYSSGSEYSGIYQTQRQSGSHYYNPRGDSTLPADVQKFGGYYRQKYGY